MKIENRKSNIIHLKFYQGKTDKDYGTCLWGNVVIDCDNYTLFIESDCGNYSYGWTPTPQTESFVKLLCRMDSGYLLGKISDMSYFDFEKSKEQTFQNIREYFKYDDTNKAQKIIENIDYDLVLSYGEEGFYRVCSEALSKYNDEIIHIEKDYPAGAKKIADIFKNTIQPYLRENFLNKELISDTPAADVAPIVHAHWERENRKYALNNFRCSNCKCASQTDTKQFLTSYCGNCGAKMDEKDSE